MSKSQQMNRNREIRMDHLANHLHFIPVIAKWQFDQWGYLHPDQTLDDRIEKLKAMARRNEIPTTIIASNSQEVVGSASLVEYDMDTHKEWSPWLACAIVNSKFRSQGVGIAMVQRIIDEARLLKIKKVYLYTFDKQDFYGRLGWKLIVNDFYREHQVTIMERHIQ